MPAKKVAGKGAAKAAPKVYDYSGLEVGMKCQAESGGSFYPAEIVVVSTSKNRSKAPIKINFKGYDKSSDEWVNGDRLRSKALKATTPPKPEPKARPERAPKVLATEGEIPIGAVARVYRGKVKDEAGALALDGLVNDLRAKLIANRKDKTKGFMKIKRQVCKTEWQYELTVVWRTFDDFTAYKTSDFRKEVNGEFEEKAKAHIVGEMYSGVRVYDELSGGGPVEDKPERAPRAPRGLATEGEIPIKRVARVYRGKVKDEAGALALDNLVNDLREKLVANRKDKTKGFIKIKRQVCKTEWSYELTVVWRSFDDFTACKTSDFRKEVNGEFEDKAKAIIVGDMYSGVRVYDEI